MQNHVWVSREGAVSALVASRLWSLTVQKILAITHTLVTAHSTTSVCSVMHCLSRVLEDLCTGEKPCCTGGLESIKILEKRYKSFKLLNGSIITAQSSRLEHIKMILHLSFRPEHI
jgi:hypothetical protein